MAKSQQPPKSIEAYLDGVENPAARKTLSTLLAQLRKLLPGATETFSYGMPTLKVDGKGVAGFAFFKQHCGFYPFSGSVVPALGPLLDGYTTSKSGVTFPPDKPLPLKLVKAIVQERLAQLAIGKPKATAKPKTDAKPKADAKPKRGSLIMDRLTDQAVKEATGRDWKGWMSALDAAGGKELSHKELVAQLAREVESGWWQQSIAVAYEQSRGMRVLGQTANSGFAIGVQRTLPMTADAAWKLVTETPERWLGAGAKVSFEPGGTYALPKRKAAPGVRGVVRVVKPGQRLRMTWQPDGWKKPATLQVTLMAKARNVSLQVNMENLPDAKAREAMRDHWARVLESLGNK